MKGVTDERDREPYQQGQDDFNGEYTRRRRYSSSRQHHQRNRQRCGHAGGPIRCHNAAAGKRRGQLELGGNASRGTAAGVPSHPSGSRRTPSAARATASDGGRRNRHDRRSGRRGNRGTYWNNREHHGLRSPRGCPSHRAAQRIHRQTVSATSVPQSIRGLRSVPRAGNGTKAAEEAVENQSILRQPQRGHHRMRGHRGPAVRPDRRSRGRIHRASDHAQPSAANRATLRIRAHDARKLEREQPVRQFQR